MIISPAEAKPNPSAEYTEIKQAPLWRLLGILWEVSETLWEVSGTLWELLEDTLGNVRNNLGTQRKLWELFRNSQEHFGNT